MGKYREALEDFENSKTIEPKTPNINKNIEEAKKKMAEAAAVDPPTPIEPEENKTEEVKKEETKEEDGLEKEENKIEEAKEEEKVEEKKDEVTPQPEEENKKEEEENEEEKQEESQTENDVVTAAVEGSEKKNSQEEEALKQQLERLKVRLSIIIIKLKKAAWCVCVLPVSHKSLDTKCDRRTPSNAGHCKY